VLSLGGCGSGGGTCAACDLIRADTCSSSGACGCGTGPMCAAGLRCVGGACTGGAGQVISLVNPGFESNTAKTWFWNWNGSSGTGALVPGAIPGWSTDENPGVGGNGGKGDSGVEPNGNPGMRLFLNSVDWEVYQTTGYLIPGGASFRLSWDMEGNWSAKPNGIHTVVVSLYYVDGTARITMGSTTLTIAQGSPWIPFSFSITAIPPPAVGKKIGLAFDNVTNLVDGGVQSWIEIDNVALVVFP
jgi:hypothetical protein